MQRTGLPPADRAKQEYSIANLNARIESPNKHLSEELVVKSVKDGSIDRMKKLELENARLRKIIVYLKREKPVLKERAHSNAPAALSVKSSPSRM